MSPSSTPLLDSEPIGNAPISPVASVARRAWLGVSRYLNANWMRCLILVCVGIAVRLPALQGERIWDDHYLANDNPFIKSPALILEAFRHYLFLDSFSAHYRPVQNISYIADYFFWNTNEFGFHLTNVLVHVGGGVLLFFLLRQLLVTFRLRPFLDTVREHAGEEQSWVAAVSFLVALVWTVHPVHSAAVDYISGRADSLAFLFAAAGWLLFLRGNRSRNRIAKVLQYLLAGLCGLLGLCSREIAIVWIVLFLAHVLFVQRPISIRCRVLIVVWCVAIVAVYAGLRQLPGKRPVILSVDQWSMPVRVTLMARALGDYGRLLVFPSNLHMERTVFDPVTYRNNASWRDAIAQEYLSVLGLIVAGGLIFGGVRPGAGRRLRCFGAFWFFAGYLPVSNIVQLNATVAEHWLYLPSVGFLLCIAGWIVELAPRYQKLSAAVAIFAAAALSGRSFIRSSDWIKEETFYQRTFDAGCRSARVALNLGQVYAARGAYAQAEKIFREVVEQNPDYPIAQNNLASILAREGKNKEAEALFALIEKNSTRTRQEYPRTWIGALNLARVRHNAGKDDSALAILERAHDDYPEVWEITSFKAEIIRERQGPDSAMRLVADFAQTNWWHHGAALALGRLYAQRGDAELADAALRRASWLDVHDTQALRLMVQMRVRENKLGDACRIQRRAIARQPDQPSEYTLLSDILEKMGREEEARETLAQASRLRALVRNQVAAN